MPPIKCFFIEPTDKMQQSLRRYTGLADEAGKCSQSGCSYHNASVLTEIAPYTPGLATHSEQIKPFDDPRWPAACVCGYAFRTNDWWQADHHRIYHRLDNGEELELRAFGPGAMYFADWMTDKGPDGRALAVVCPTSDDRKQAVWQVDTTASNCDMKCKNCGQDYRHHYSHLYRADFEIPAGAIEAVKDCPKYEGVDNGAHRCWVRHGDPRTGIISVDKAGNTCGAGQGSIMIGGWHGHLKDGYLIEIP